MWKIIKTCICTSKIRKTERKRVAGENFLKENILWKEENVSSVSLTVLFDCESYLNDVQHLTELCYIFKIKIDRVK